MTVRARLLVGDVGDGLSLGLRRLGRPAAARAPLEHFTVLLTGLGAEEARFLAKGYPLAQTGGASPAASPGAVFTPGDPTRRPGSALLTGSREQLARVIAACTARVEFTGVARQLEGALGSLASPSPLILGTRTLTFGRRTHLMGIVNVTPDSFSDGGRFGSTDTAVAHGLSLIEAGADLLDVGGESTRPGAKPVTVEEELARVLPVIRGLRERTDVPLSIDTTKADVAREALRAGAAIVNDISGFTRDPALPGVVAEAKAACVLMHIQGTPETMQQAPEYEDVIDAVLAHLEAGIARAIEAGIPRERIVVDPGIGFGKTAGHNLFLLRRVHELRCLGRPLLIGTSRKAFIGALSGRAQASERLAGTLGSLAVVATLRGADIVRVHDVREAREALAVADAIVHGEEGGTALRRSGPQE